MAYTTNYNLPELPTGAVDWVAVINDIMAKLEAGRTFKVTAGEALAINVPVYMHTDGEVYKADNTKVYFGLTQAAIANGAEGYVLICNGAEVTNAGWSWTVGGEIFVHTVAGELSQSEPATPTVVGIASAATKLVLK